MDPIVQGLVDYGIAGLFLIYMIWSKAKDQKRSDEMRVQYEQKLDKLHSDSFVEQEKIRERYRQVVEKYDDQIMSYANERQMQINTYAEERQEARRIQEAEKKAIERSLHDIRKEVGENGKAIARLQTQMESWTVRIAR
tara:strand:+ start:496 stop:912 length:417 start_codon:yes stop_codon:yes gene_type:complete